MKANISITKKLSSYVIVRIIFMSWVGFCLIYFYRPLRELDFFWRILIGKAYVENPGISEYGLHTWSVVDVNPEWKTTQPLGEILLYLIYKVGGLELISLTMLAIWLLIVIQIYRRLLKYIQRDSILDGTNNSILLILSMLAIFLLIPFIQERPQTFVLLIFALISHRLISDLGTVSRGSSITTLSMIAFAVHIHPAWIVLYSSFAATLMFTILKYVFRKAERHFIRQLVREKWVPIIFMVGIPVLVILGPARGAYFERLIAISEAGFKNISEWQPLSDTGKSDVLIGGYMCFAILICHLTWKIKNSFREKVLWSCIMVVLLLPPFVSARFVPFSILLTIAFISVWIEPHKNIKQKFTNKRASIVGIQALKNNPLSAFEFLPFIFLISALLLSAYDSTGATKDFYKSAPIELIRTMKSDSKIFVINGPNEGGFIHFFGDGNLIPFIDGRADRYRPSAINDLDFILKSEQESGTLLNSQKFERATELLVAKSLNFEPARATGFRLVCEDKNFLRFSRESAPSCG